MKLFAHRGNTEGPLPEVENHPNYIRAALAKGFCAEIDVWYQDKSWYLGHNKAQHAVPFEFLIDSRLLIHAKDVNTFYELLKYPNIHSFYQKGDEIVLSRIRITLELESVEADRE